MDEKDDFIPYTESELRSFLNDYEWHWDYPQAMGLRAFRTALTALALAETMERRIKEAREYAEHMPYQIEEVAKLRLLEIFDGKEKDPDLRPNPPAKSMLDTSEYTKEGKE